MGDIQAIRLLTRALEGAALEENWSQVKVVDKQIASLLTSLAKTSLSEEKREALEQLRGVHLQVNDQCRQKSDALERKMALQRRNREGIVAYAAFMDEEDMG